MVRRPQPRSAKAAAALAELRREAAAAYAHVSVTGVGMPPSRAPNLFALYEYVVGYMRHSRGARYPSLVSFMGVSFPCRPTNLGRVRILDPDTGEELVAGRIGDLW